MNFEELQQKMDNLYGEPDEKPIVTKQDLANDPHLEIHKNHDIKDEELLTSDKHRENNQNTEQIDGNNEKIPTLSSLQKKIRGSFSSKNKSLFEKLTAKAKNIIYGTYKGVEQPVIPNQTTNKIFAGMEIWNTSRIMHNYEADAAKQAAKIEKIDSELLDARDDLADLENELKDAEGFLEKRLLGRKIEKATNAISKLENKKNLAFTKWQNYDDAMSHAQEERNTIVENMMARYEGSRESMKSKLESLKSDKAAIDKQIENFEQTNAENIKELTKLENEKKEKSDRYERLKYSDKEARKKLERVNKKIADIHESMRLQKKILTDERNKIGGKIIEANKYLADINDKYFEYARIMEEKPTSANFPERQREVKAAKAKEINPHYG